MGLRRFWPLRRAPIEGHIGEYGRDRQRSGQPKAARPTEPGLARVRRRM